MKQKRVKNRGFFLSYIFNFIFSFELGVLALVFFGLDIWLDSPALIWQLLLVAWVVWPLITTIFLSFVTNTVEEDKNKTQPQNKNPYSASTQNYIDQMNNNNNNNNSSK